jgi:hypothetical protein
VSCCGLEELQQLHRKFAAFCNKHLGPDWQELPELQDLLQLPPGKRYSRQHMPQVSRVVLCWVVWLMRYLHVSRCSRISVLVLLQDCDYLAGPPKQTLQLFVATPQHPCPVACLLLVVAPYVVESTTQRSTQPTCNAL